LQEQQTGTGIYTLTNRSSNTMNNDIHIDRSYISNRINYSDLIERVENLEKQYEIKRNKELVRVF
jgi:hypothetical protein